jgi:iron-sulfur cluster assembly protein
MIITVTETASKKIQQTIQKRGKGLGIRVGVKTTGCSGLAYVLEYVDEPSEYDIRIDCEGCNLFVDPKSCAYMQGMTVDYVRTGLNEGFEFSNPNERDRCGCGESFRV